MNWNSNGNWAPSNPPSAQQWPAWNANPGQRPMHIHPAYSCWNQPDMTPAPNQWRYPSQSEQVEPAVPGEENEPAANSQQVQQAQQCSPSLPVHHSYVGWNYAAPTHYQQTQPAVCPPVAYRAPSVHPTRPQSYAQTVRHFPPTAHAGQPPRQSQLSPAPRPHGPKAPNSNPDLPAENPGDSGTWPPSLRSYVNRCFQSCTTDIDKDRVEIMLKGKITSAAADKSMWTKDWDAEPLITLSAKGSKGQRVQMTLAKENPVRPNAKDSIVHTPLKQNIFDRLNARSDASSSNSTNVSTPKKRPQSPPGSDGYLPLTPGGQNRSPDDTMGLSKRAMRKARARDKKNSRGSSLAASKANQMRTEYEDNNQARGKNKMTLDGDIGGLEMRAKRAARFSKLQNSKVSLSSSVGQPFGSPSTYIVDNGGEDDYGEPAAWLKSLHIVGTCTAIDKEYLRLTSAPEPSSVRPPPVLHQALHKAKTMWKSGRDYHSVCDAIKSIRQDLTIQGIRDELTVQVYETHARIALEQGDHTEFNQCQSQLKALYVEVGRKGSSAADNRLEFTAYRILYYIYRNHMIDLSTTLGELSREDKQDACVAYALNIRQAIAMDNYNRLFRLIREAGREMKMCHYLIGWFLDRCRRRALARMIKAFRPSLDVPSVMHELAFGKDFASFAAFVQPFKLVHGPAANGLSLTSHIDCKESMNALPSIEEDKEINPAAL